MQDNLNTPSFKTWEKHSDARGALYFNNAYLFDEVKRIYFIEHTDVSVERGWRAHKIEQRWFVPMTGSFEIKIVKIDDFDTPNPFQKVNVLVLDQEILGTLHVPKGYATLLKALTPHSKIMVMADSYFEEAKLDDYLFPIDYFKDEAIG